MGVGHRRRVAFVILAAALLAGACSSPRRSEATGPSFLKAEIVSCTPLAAGGQRLVVAFRPTADAPEELASLLPRLGLRSYAYRPSTAPVEATRVAFPVPPEVLQGLGLHPGDATVAEGPPPAAIVALEGAVPALVFEDLSLFTDEVVEIRARDLRALQGRSAETPLGTARVSAVRVQDGRVTITATFDWLEGIGGGSSLAPEVGLAPQLGKAGLLLAGITLPVADGRTRSVSVPAPADVDLGPAVLRLGPFGVSIPGPITATAAGRGCGGAGSSVSP
jgi:hypothetical protein